MYDGLQIASFLHIAPQSQLRFAMYCRRHQLLSSFTLFSFYYAGKYFTGLRHYFYHFDIL